ncbi:MAG: protein kinase domain-containing protein [Blastocatellia bacterium]
MTMPMTTERWRRIEDIFQSVADLPPAEQAAMLSEQCGDDLALRREIENLLGSADEDDFLQNPIQAAARFLPESAEDELSGSRIGPYHIVRRLGQGGMGAVYLAERDDAEYYREVAIKVVRRGMDTGFVLNRFRVERQILASLEHPHIARLLDGGTTDDGLPYFVMEYVAGKPLAEYCRERELTIEERLRLFLPVCAAVQHAHQKLIVHRDLKPGNILVTAEGTPKLLDFGIAKLLDPSFSPIAAQTTLTAVRLMTPDYASPEQVRGVPVTTASDVYSLGAVLYELLTGERPHRFAANTPVEIERAICDTAVERPSAVAQRTGGALTRTHRRLTGDLDNIVMMALRKEPERRYQSVERFAQDIQCYLAGHPISARSESFAYRSGKFVRRHKLAVTAAALILISLLGGIVTTTRAARVARAERARAESSLDSAVAARAEAEKQRAEAERQRLLAERQSAETLTQRERAEAQAVEAGRQRRFAETQRADAQAQRATAERRFAEVRKLANTFLFEFEEKIRPLAGSTEARAMIVNTATTYLDLLAKEARGDSALQAELAGAWQKVGDVQGSPELPNLGQARPALESYGKAIALAETLLAREPANEKLTRLLATNYYKLAFLQLRHVGVEVARPPLLRAEALTGRLSYETQSDPENFALAAGVRMLLGNQALTPSEAGRLAFFRKYLDIAGRWAAAQPGERPQSFLMRGYERAGNSLANMGDLEASLDMGRQAVAIAEALVRNHPADALLRRELANQYNELSSLLGDPTVLNLGRTAEAVDMARKAVALGEELAGADPKNALARRDLLRFYRGHGVTLRELDPVESAKTLQKLYDYARASSPTGRLTNGLEADTLAQLGRSQARSGEAAAARQNLQRVREILRAADPAELFRVGLSLTSFEKYVSDLLQELGEPGEALAYQNRWLAALLKEHGESPADLYQLRNVANSYNALGNCHMALADQPGLGEAEKTSHWRQALGHYRKSLATWREWPRKGVSSVFNQSRQQQVENAIVRCETLLAGMNAQPPR